MTDRYLIGVDIGTTGSKGVLTDLKGRVMAYRFLEHDVDTPRPGWCEQDADEVWWGDLTRITRALLQASGVPAETVAAIGVSALTPDVLLIDSDGRPLHKGILYSDNRAVAEFRELNETLGAEKIWSVAGRNLAPDSVGCKVLWLQRNEPRLWERARGLHSATSYLVFRLTGASVIDYAIANGFTPLFNAHQRQWDADMCAALGVSLDRLPELRWATQPAGMVHGQAAAETGLAEGTVVITGTGDTFAEMVSVGAAQEGDAGLIYGTTMSMMAMVNEFRASRQIHFGFAALPNTYRVGFAMTASAALTRWYRDQFGQPEKEAEASLGISAYQLLSQEASDIPPGSQGLLVLPYFAGERSPIYDPAARGLILGLTLSHTRRHVYRALLEGVALGLRHSLEILRGEGIVIRRIIGTGGGTRSQLWTQIVSDVIGQDQEIVTSPYGAPLGGAFLSGFGAGLFEDLTPLRTDWVQTTGTVRWNPAAKRVYDRYFDVYRELYPRLAEDMHALAALSMMR